MAASKPAEARPIRPDFFPHEVGERLVVNPIDTFLQVVLLVTLDGQVFGQVPQSEIPVPRRRPRTWHTISAVRTAWAATSTPATSQSNWTIGAGTAAQ